MIPPSDHSSSNVGSLPDRQAKHETAHRNHPFVQALIHASGFLPWAASCAAFEPHQHRGRHQQRRAQQQHVQRRAALLPSEPRGPPDAR
ncbi:hypothetical protein G6F61_014975 [Rhizopus arrhizus]|nr:hypothetical protein G6F61_014975 [Rhizopus arrhizus]